ncbi:Gfo/Idh/MocA family protein [Microlunatus parietis]|uniref:Putative dehydrogenase n=1 Tax=Microlunatus parietis TaxID=682979 RepID=A0A7Y9LE41_9ACTN|nr:Gfo/Idh/MocA family oxidoreductase [Microlunatus parietis]NYE73438.1 putative dehydrogenase [Microlunatus parietis]
MIDDFAEISDAVRITLPRHARRRIGIIGAGAIVDVAHLPAYRALGLEVVAIADLDRAKAADVAARHGIGTAYGSAEELLADPRVEVIDIAVTAAAQPALAGAVIQSGRPVLAQKPFAPDVATGQGIVDLAAERKVALAVNQQLRFDEGIAAAHRMIELGWIGDVTAMSIMVDIRTAFFDDWPWMRALDRVEITYHSIHYHDVIRWFLGDPDAVFCAAGRQPGQPGRGETRTISTYLYGSGVRALVHANHDNLHGDNSATFRIEGTKGAIRGTLGLLYDYPRGRPDTLELHSTVLPTDGWLPYPVTTRWIPDAFRGPISSLLNHLADGTPLRSSGADNLGTLRLVEALYTSIDEARSVELVPG